MKVSKRTRERRKLVSACDALVREIVFDRDGWKCVRCNTKKALTPSHVYPKGKYANLRYAFDNLLTMCVACHLYWWHLQPIESAEWFAKQYPERAKWLKIAKDATEKPDLSDLYAYLVRQRAEEK